MHFHVPSGYYLLLLLLPSSFLFYLVLNFVFSFYFPPAILRSILLLVEPFSLRVIEPHRIITSVPFPIWNTRSKGRIIPPNGEKPLLGKPAKPKQVRRRRRTRREQGKTSNRIETQSRKKQFKTLFDA